MVTRGGGWSVIVGMNKESKGKVGVFCRYMNFFRLGLSCQAIYMEVMGCARFLVVREA